MTSGSDKSSGGGGTGAVCRIIIHLVIHKMIGVVLYRVIYVAAVILPEQELTKFHYHIIFSVVGYQLLLVEAIMSFNKESSWIRHFSRKTVKIFHLTLAVLGAGFSLAGAILIMVLRGGQFQSAHGICGLIAMLFSILCLVNGTLTYFSLELRNKLKPAIIKAVHTICGLGSVIMGLVTLCIGINKPVFSLGVSDNTGIGSTLTGFVVVILLYVIWNPVMSMVGSIKNMRTTEL